MSGKPVVKFEGSYFFLSNFYSAPITFPAADGDVTFPTNEHAFQSVKHKVLIDRSLDARVDYVRKVMNAPTPAKAKRVGMSVAIDSTRWDLIKNCLMREICKAKFDQHPDLIPRLLDTDGMLVEGNTWGGTYWGRCEGRGLNVLGVILTELRGYYRLTPSTHG